MKSIIRNKNSVTGSEINVRFVKSMKYVYFHNWKFQKSGLKTQIQDCYTALAKSIIICISFIYNRYPLTNLQIGTKGKVKLQWGKAKTVL